MCINDWVLEIGSARGNLINNAINNEIKIYCNDICEDHINQIKSDNVNKLNIKYLVGDFLSVDFEENLKLFYVPESYIFLIP